MVVNQQGSELYLAAFGSSKIAIIDTELLEQGRDYDEAVDEYRWLLEEFRVSLFAQQLGTRAKVSVKRLRQAWQKIG